MSMNAAGQNPATPQAPAAGAPEGTPAAGTPEPNAAPAADPNAAPAPGTPEPNAAPASPPPVAPGDPNAAAAAAAAATKAAEGTPWYQGLPEAQHEALKGFATPEDAVAAIEAGSKFTVAKSVDAYQFTFADPDTDQAAPAIASYKQHCLDNGISPEQAQKTLEYQTGVLEEAQQQAKVAGEQQLRADWGNNFDGNLTKALTALTFIDRDTGGSLAAKLKQNGGANDPDIVKALLWVSDKIGEDNLGAGGPGGTPLDKPITTEEAYAEMFGAAK